MTQQHLSYSACQGTSKHLELCLTAGCANADCMYCQVHHKRQRSNFWASEEHAWLLVVMTANGVASLSMLPPAMAGGGGAAVESEYVLPSTVCTMKLAVRPRAACSGNHTNSLRLISCIVP